MVERREAPPPYVTGGRVPRQGARRPALSAAGPYVIGPGASRRSIPSFRGTRKKGKGEPGSPKKVKSPGSIALASMPGAARREKAMHPFAARAGHPSPQGEGGDPGRAKRDLGGAGW